MKDALTAFALVFLGVSRCCSCERLRLLRDLKTHGESKLLCLDRTGCAQATHARLHRRART